MKNLFSEIPDIVDEEQFQEILTCETIRIERIISRGQTSPASGWYEQDENEWVMVLVGSGTITFNDGHEVTLIKGEFVTIPANKKHRVSWTDPDVTTIWLAIFYK